MQEENIEYNSLKEGIEPLVNKTYNTFKVSALRIAGMEKNRAPYLMVIRSVLSRLWSSRSQMREERKNELHINLPETGPDKQILRAMQEGACFTAPKHRQYLLLV